jgi:glycerol-3-phosphate acyltransferase PlsY
MKKAALSAVVVVLALIEIALVLGLFSPIYSYTNLVSASREMQREGGNKNLDALNKEKHKIIVIKTGIYSVIIVAIICNFLLLKKVSNVLKIENGKAKKVGPII